MILVNDMPGQMCNRLWSFAPFVAHSLESGNRLVIPYFGEYASAFDDLNIYPKINIVTRRNGVNFRFWRYSFKMLKVLHTLSGGRLSIYADRARWGQENWDPAIVANPRNVVALSAWNHRKPSTDLVQYRSEIATLFQPKVEHRRKVEKVIAAARAESDIVVGIHMRLSDFKDFVGGRYYFTQDEYVAVMRSLQNQLAPKKVHFLLCSDEAVQYDLFTEFRCSTIPTPTAIEDLYALSRTDWIVSGPSTFAMWASFTGGVPMRVLEHHGEPVLLEEFSRCNGLYSFEDGHRFEFENKEFDYLKVYNTSP